MTSVPDARWKNNIKGASDGKVDQRNIDGILKDTMKAYDNWVKNSQNKGKEFKYKIDNDDMDK